MNSSNIFKVLVFVALVGCVLAGSIAAPGSNIDNSEVGSTTLAPESSEQQQPKDTYFGVDANDKEAVKEVQKELADQKFKEMFGNDVDVQEFNFYEADDAADAPVNGQKKMGSLMEGIQLLMKLFSQQQAPKKED